MWNCGSVKPLAPPFIESGPSLLFLLVLLLQIRLNLLCCLLHLALHSLHEEEDKPHIEGDGHQLLRHAHPISGSIWVRGLLSSEDLSQVHAHAAEVDVLKRVEG